MLKRFTLFALTIALSASPGVSAENAARTIPWKTSWNETVKAAEQGPKNILLLFTNPERCPPCRMMEKQTWPDPRVVGFVNANFVPLMIHTGRSEEPSLANEFTIRGIPTTLVIDTKKNVIARKAGFLPPEDLLKLFVSATSLEKLQKQVKAAPANTGLKFDLANAYMELERGASASPLLEEIVGLDKDNASGDKIRALYLLGKIAFQNSDTENARKRFHEVAELDPEGKTEYADDNALQLALLRADGGDFSSAATEFEKFLTEFPKSDLHADALLYLGRCHSLAGDEDASAKAFEKLVRDYPGSRHAEYAKRLLQHLKRTAGGAQ